MYHQYRIINEIAYIWWGDAKPSNYVVYLMLTAHLDSH